MLHVCHITPGLGCGGAENTLYRLVTSLDRRQYRNTIISLTGPGHFGPLLTEAMVGVPYMPRRCSTGPLGSRSNRSPWRW